MTCTHEAYELVPGGRLCDDCGLFTAFEDVECDIDTLRDVAA